MGTGYCHHSPNQFFLLFQRLITGIVLRTFRRCISTSGSPELAIHRLSASRLLAIRARVVRLLASPNPLTLLLALFSSLISSTIRTSRPTPRPPSARRWRSDRPGPSVFPWVAPAIVLPYVTRAYVYLRQGCPGTCVSRKVAPSCCLESFQGGSTLTIFNNKQLAYYCCR